MVLTYFGYRTWGKKRWKKSYRKKSMSQRAYKDVEADMANSAVDIVT